MKFFGLQKLSLLDFPGKMCATVFTGGCNFRCPFCHNSSLVVGELSEEGASYDEEEILAFLKKRVGVLDGICITGGEPTLYGERLISFMKRIKELGMLIKLDTNGSRPDVLRAAVESGAVDYVAMDIKSSVSGYPLIVGPVKIDMDAIIESAKYLMEDHVDFEFRTTVVKPLHKASDFEEIGKLLGGDEKYFIQSYKDSGDILFDSDSKTREHLKNELSPDESARTENLSAYSEAELGEFLATIKKYIPRAELRGV